MPQISILLTCFNHLRFLPPAYLGILNQTFADYEILALDDGSTDGTRDWLKEREDGKMRCIFHETNLGTYPSLNVGVGEAKGEFIAILNDDDIWAPGKLGAQIDLFSANPKLGMVHTSGWFIDDDGARHPDPRPLGFPFPDLPSGNVLPNLMFNNQVITSAALIKREVFDQCGLFDPSFYGCGDWHMWLRIAQKFEIGFVPEPLTFYRVHGSNAALNDQRMFEDSHRIREWIASWDSNQPELRSSYAHNWACLGTERTWLGDKAGGRKAYVQALKLNPGRFKTYLRLAATYLPQKGFQKIS
jgi:glycosyltransferase involved in cell wall biosynthesis